MLVTCWSAKGGSGTTVVAAALAVMLARASESSALIDLGGDAPAVLGMPEPQGPGFLDWARAADSGVEAEALWRLATDAGGGLRVVHRGSALSSASAEGSASSDPTLAGSGDGSNASVTDAARIAARVVDGAAASGTEAVVVDAGGPGELAFEVAARSTLSLLVLRPCYLALRRALQAPVRPSAIVLVDEPDRSLCAADVEDVLGVSVRAVVPWDKAIARTVDAGLLRTRVPRVLATSLRAAT